MTKKNAQSPRGGLFPKALSRCVEAVVKPAFKKRGFAEHRILTDWDRIVGADVAAHSSPLKLSFPPGKKRDGTLHIQVTGGFALELQHMQPIILERIAVYFGYPAVARLSLLQAPVEKK